MQLSILTNQTGFWYCLPVDDLPWYRRIRLETAAARCFGAIERPAPPGNKLKLVVLPSYKVQMILLMIAGIGYSSAINLWHLGWSLHPLSLAEYPSWSSIYQNNPKLTICCRWSAINHWQTWQLKRSCLLLVFYNLEIAMCGKRGWSSWSQFVSSSHRPSNWFGFWTPG